MSATGLEEVLSASLIRAGEPLTATALRRALGKPLPASDDVAAGLERLVVLGRAFRIGSRWTSVDPRARASETLREILASAPAGVPPAKLKAELKRRAPTLVSLYAEAIEDLRAGDLVHAHFGWKAGGKRGTKVVTLALHPEPPPDPQLLLAGVRAPVRRLAETALACGISETALADAVRRLAASDRALVQVALRLLGQREPRGALLSLNDLRLSVALDKPSFDRAVLALRHDGFVRLFQHDDPGSLGRVERGALVVDPSGTHYVGIVESEES